MLLFHLVAVALYIRFLLRYDCLFASMPNSSDSYTMKFTTTVVSLVLASLARATADDGRMVHGGLGAKVCAL
jgi:hypothetical protein